MCLPSIIAKKLRFGMESNEHLISSDNEIYSGDYRQRFCFQQDSTRYNLSQFKFYVDFICIKFFGELFTSKNYAVRYIKKRLTDFVVEQVRNIGTSIQSATHAGDKGGFLTYISKYKIRRMRSLYKIDSLLIFL